MVILGLLYGEDLSGYDLKSTIEQTIGHFWNESYGQLYPALKELTAQGLVQRSESPSGGRKRSVYSITEAGRERLRNWLSEAPAPRAVRNELLLKLFFGQYGDDEAMVNHLEQERLNALGEFRSLEGAARHLQQSEPDAPELRHWLVTLDLGRRMASARAEWAAESLAILRDK